VTVDQAQRLKALARWHRRMALVVCAWLVVLAISGLLINHAHDWGLDRSPLAESLQRLVYGIDTETGEFCGRAVTPGPDCTDVFAALAVPGGELLLGGGALFLLDGQGRLVEKVSAGQLGLGQIEAGLFDAPGVYLRDSQRVVWTDPGLLDWRLLDPAEATALAGRDWQVRDNAGVKISWERFLLDLHAARFLGPLAQVFTDLMGGLVLLLALSGLWLWWLKGRRD
jgi:hypothetical protein